MPATRPEASGLANLVAKAEKRYNVSPLLMTTEAAAAIGVSKATLQRWRQSERLLPYTEIRRGHQAPIPLYGPTEISTGRVLRRESKPGPVPVKKRAARPPAKRKVRQFYADQEARAAAQAGSAR